MESLPREGRNFISHTNEAFDPGTRLVEICLGGQGRVAGNPPIGYNRLESGSIVLTYSRVERLET